MDRIDLLLNRARMGDLSPQERQELQQALMTLPPASEDFQMISEALGRKTWSQNKEAHSGVPNPFDIFKSGRGVPTLDFLSPIGSAFNAAPGSYAAEGPDLYANQQWSPFGDDKAAPSTAADLQGEAPIGSDTEVPETEAPKELEVDWTDPAALGGEDLSKYYTEIPDDYSFSDFNREGLLDLSYSPERFARNYATEMGRPGSAALYEDAVRAAMAMSATGAIAPGGQEIGDTLQSARGMPQGQRLQAVEDFMDQYTSKGVDIRPDAIFEEMFERSYNTDMSKLESPQTKQPMTTDEIIDYTNQSLLAAAPFMVPEAAASVQSTLEYYANEYRNLMASTDGPTLSYPAFLKQNGVDQLLRD